MTESWIGETQAWARERGFRVVLGSPAMLDGARELLARRVAAGEVDEELTASYYLKALIEADPAGLGRFGAVLAIATPAGARRTIFEMPDGSGPVSTFLPPTYSAPPELTRDALRKELEAGPLAGLEVAPIRVVEKTASVALGLATYGRNNITYVDGFGSYQRPVFFGVGAAPPSGRSSGKAEVVEAAIRAGLSPECEGCSACREACPTGAIPEADDRFLLHAGRCLTLHNELDCPFPEWIPQAAHTCLVGCMACQEACPQNRGLLRFDEPDLVFSAEETAAILAGEAEAAILERVKEKFASVAAGFDAVAFSRNLGAIVRAGEVEATA